MGAFGNSRSASTTTTTSTTAEVGGAQTETGAINQAGGNITSGGFQFGGLGEDSSVTINATPEGAFAFGEKALETAGQNFGAAAGAISTGLQAQAEQQRAALEALAPAVGGRSFDLGKIVPWIAVAAALYFIFRK